MPSNERGGSNFRRADVKGEKAFLKNHEMGKTGKGR